jgi:hypothetical protein
MNKTMLTLASFVWVGAVLADIRVYVPKESGDSDIGFADATDAMAHAFATVDRFEIYEGWPRVTVNAKNILTSQPQDAPPLEIDGELFYQQAQKPAEGDVLTLRRLTGVKLLRPWHGVKLCGGFHADFAVRFELEDDIYSILFCFGCHEARLVRAQSARSMKQTKADFRLTTDLAPELFNELRALLLKYRKHDLVRS